MILMHELIADVIAGRRTAEDAATHTHPYAIDLFRPTTKADADALSRIRTAYRARHAQPVRQTGGA